MVMGVMEGMLMVRYLYKSKTKHSTIYEEISSNKFCLTLAGCFSRHSLVCVSDGEQVKMKDLSIGQSLMTLDEEGSPRETTFLGWLHRDTNLKTEFLKITTDNGQDVTLTPGHIIMVNSGMKLASQVTLSDLLVTKTGPAVVVTIERMVTTGVYSPLTTTSTVLVSGVLCSCFAATSQNTIAEGRVASYHGQAHSCFAPVRTFPALLEDPTSQDKVRIDISS